MPGETLAIVVVEDDASMSQAIERILRAGGYATTMFESAEATLAAGPATADCLLLDIHLPGMCGLDLYRRLAPRGDEVPAVFMTAYDEPAVREEAESMGSFLAKPFSGRTLLAVIAETLNRDPR